MLNESLVQRYALALVFTVNGAAALLIVVSRPEDRPFVMFYHFNHVRGEDLRLRSGLMTSVFNTDRRCRRVS
jgi:hypothetical protein